MLYFPLALLQVPSHRLGVIIVAGRMSNKPSESNNFGCAFQSPPNDERSREMPEALSQSLDTLVVDCQEVRLWNRLQIH